MTTSEIDKLARDLPTLTLHGNIPTATTLAFAARLVHVLDRVAELETAEMCRTTGYGGKPYGPSGRYKPKDLKSKLGYLVEECGEVLQAVGKALRWGTQNVNPELPVDQQETNREWILREICDLRAAIDIVEEGLDLGDIEHPDQRGVAESDDV